MLSSVLRSHDSYTPRREPRATTHSFGVCTTKDLRLDLRLVAPRGELGDHLDHTGTDGVRVLAVLLFQVIPTVGYTGETLWSSRHATKKNVTVLVRSK